MEMDWLLNFLGQSWKLSARGNWMRKVTLTAPIISQTPITNEGRAVCGCAPGAYSPECLTWLMSVQCAVLLSQLKTLLVHAMNTQQHGADGNMQRDELPLLVTFLGLSASVFFLPRTHTKWLWNDLYCVEWGVKLYSLTHSAKPPGLVWAGRTARPLEWLTAWFSSCQSARWRPTGVGRVHLARLPDFFHEKPPTTCEK